MNWKNKKVLITGGSSGIGAHLVQLLTQREAQVVFGGLNKEEVVKTARHLNAKGIAADLTKEEELVSFFHEAVQYMGGIDILVNNAGYVIARDFEDLTRGNYEHMFSINCIAPARLSQLAIPYFKKSGTGDIVNIGATGGYYAFEQGTAYSCSKAALSLLSKSLNLSFRKDNIRVFHIDPSWCTDTNNDNDGGKIPKDETKLNPSDITASIVHLLEMHRRAFVSQMSISGTAPKAN